MTRAQKMIAKWRKRDTVYKRIHALQRQLSAEVKWVEEWEEYKLAQ